jgi:hypothetical protein
MFGSKDDADCPLWRGPCRGDKCRWHVQLLGKHPQTGADISEAGCAMQFLPMLMIENSNQQRQTGKAVESFRNEMVNANGIAAIQQQIFSALDAKPDQQKLIGN